MKTLNSNTVELHYHFTDHEHRIDAFVQNRCEHELLTLMKELTKYFEFEFLIETELTQSGGIRKFFKIKPNDLSKKDKKQIDIAVRTAICTALITSFLINPLSIPATKIVSNLMDKIFEDKELAEIEKEKAKEELKSLKLDNIKKQQEIESNAQLRISRSNFYEILNEYDRLDSVEFLEEDEQKNKVIVYQRIPQIDFEKYIIQQDILEDEVVENAMIAIVSPVLSKKTKDIKWRGYYNGELIPLIMKSEEFVTSVDEGLIEFKNGFIINCNLRIEREKKKDDEEKRRYIVTEVISYVINEKVFETMEGKRYKQAKKDEADTQYLPFDELNDKKE